MPINDYRCDSCNSVFEDEFKVPEKCEKCGHTSFTLCTAWHGRNIAITDNFGYCTDGYTINRFKAKHDPLCQIELGMRGANHTSLRTFTPEQREVFRGKMDRGEDSHKLRQEILDVRERNLSEKKHKKRSNK